MGYMICRESPPLLDKIEIIKSEDNNKLSQSIDKGKLSNQAKVKEGEI